VFPKHQAQRSLGQLAVVQLAPYNFLLYFFVKNLLFSLTKIHTQLTQIIQMEKQNNSSYKIWFLQENKHMLYRYSVRCRTVKSTVSQGCQMNISMKSQTVLKKARKRPNRLFKGQKKSQNLFAVLLFLCHKETFKLQEYEKNVFEITIKLTLAWHCVGGGSPLLLILLWLFMVYEIAHFGYNSATVCILIHRQLSAPTWKPSPNNFCTYDKNHCSPSTSWRH